jgi:hypothetical protein
VKWWKRVVRIHREKIKYESLGKNKIHHIQLENTCKKAGATLPRYPLVNRHKGEELSQLVTVGKRNQYIVMAARVSRSHSRGRNTDSSTAWQRTCKCQFIYLSIYSMDFRFRAPDTTIHSKTGLGTAPGSWILTQSDLI